MTTGHIRTMADLEAATYGMVGGTGNALLKSSGVVGGFGTPHDASSNAFSAASGLGDLYNLLNASTEYITQNIEGERFELASRMTRGITSRLKKAAESGKVLETLTTLPKQDEVLTITE